jgi:hypothetical protein
MKCILVNLVNINFIHFALICVILVVQESRSGLELSDIHKLLVCTDDVNLFGPSMYAIKGRKTGTLLDATKEIALDTNAERTKHLFMSRH